MKIIILGCGLVGGPMAIDLAKNKQFNVSIADINKVSLEKLKINAGNLKIKTICADLSRSNTIKKLVSDYDIVVNSLPGSIGFQTLKVIIEAGKNVIDIAFFPEDPFQLDKLAKKQGVIAIVDCGVAPGMSNLLVGYADSMLNKTETAIIYVGGLPVKRDWPYEYKAVFSPADVIEEYTRPAQYIENGKLVIRPALTDAEYIDFPKIGTLEAFNTDGLRTIANTIKATNLKEKTLRYPGHIEKIVVLRETGFFSKEKIEIQGIKIRPLDFTSKLLFPKWKLNQGEQDFTVMKVIIEGIKNGGKIRYTYDLLDYYDSKTDTHSMARTTGYTATAAVNLLAQNLYKKTGISPPEFLGKLPECVKYILNYLKKRNVIYTETISSIE